MNVSYRISITIALLLSLHSLASGSLDGIFTPTDSVINNAKEINLAQLAKIQKRDGSKLHYGGNNNDWHLFYLLKGKYQDWGSGKTNKFRNYKMKWSQAEITNSFETFTYIRSSLPRIEKLDLKNRRVTIQPSSGRNGH